MARLFSLDSRLSLCAELVRCGSRLADIGTDHAFLPVHLVLEGKIPSAIAADISPDPLEKGRQTIEKYGLQSCISTRLCNGLANISRDEVDDIVIAGMGGDTIIGILHAASWIKDPKKRLILQPMTKANKVVEYLSKEGFEITLQKACEAGGKLYTVMAAHYTGKSFEAHELFTYLGKLSPEENPLDRRYLSHQAELLRKKALGNKRYGELAEKIIGRLTDYDNNKKHI